ncbi:MAG: amidohydrolase [Caldilineaceae bacterium]
MPMNPSTLLIQNAHVYTGDPDLPHAEAIVVRGNRIVFVGNNADARACCATPTERIDGADCTLAPGLIDSHFHLLWGSLKLESLQLDSATDMAHLGELIQRYAADHPERHWIEGYQLRYTIIPPEHPLDRHFLDALVPDRPLLIFAFDMHTAWANSAALRRANLLHGRELPPGNEIVMAADTGTATGELREFAAYEPIRDLIPKLTAQERRRLLKKGLVLAAQHGITSVHNMDNKDNQIDVYAALEAAGEMSLRVYMPYDIKPETPLAALGDAAAMAQHYRGSHVRAGAIKLFMDGVLESYTALMVDDYADAPGNRGMALYTAEHFNAIAAEADRLGLQIFVHACGEGAVRRALDGYAHARRVNGRRDSRHRVEHIETLHPDDLPRFAELGVIASMQPLHSPITRHDAEVWPLRAGEARWPLSFAWQTLRNAGAQLAFGSDWPVVTLDPMRGFYAALNREPWVDDHPSQRQTLAQTIAGYTRDAAYAEFMETEKGMIRAGMLADLVLFDGDLFATPAAVIDQVRPRMTICDGKIVWRAA